MMLLDPGNRLGISEVVMKCHNEITRLAEPSPWEPDSITVERFLNECRKLEIKGVPSQASNCLVANYFKKKLALPENMAITVSSSITLRLLDKRDACRCSSPGCLIGVNNRAIEVFRTITPHVLQAVVQGFDSGQLNEFVDVPFMTHPPVMFIPDVSEKIYAQYQEQVAKLKALEPQVTEPEPQPQPIPQSPQSTPSVLSYLATEVFGGVSPTKPNGAILPDVAVPSGSSKLILAGANH